MDEENVQYSFTGDVSSLRQATLAAINLLSSYENKLNSIGNNSGFSKVTNSIRNSVSSVRKSLEALTYVPKHATDAKSAIDKVDAAINSMKSNVASVVLATAISFNTFKMRVESVTNSIKSMQEKASTALNRVTTFANSVSAAFRRLGQSENESSDAADSTGKRHNALTSILNRVRSLFQRETESIEEEEEELDKKNKTLRESEKGHSRLGNVLSNLGRLFSSESGRVRNFSNSLGILSSVSNFVKNTLGALTGIKLGDWLAQGLKRSIEFVENLNLFKVALGESTAEGLKFVDAMSELYGMDPSNLYRYTGYFYQLTDAIGMADEASSVMSLSLTKAANDIASLFNVDIETVVNNLASGMQGMARSVRKYGMDIRAVTLQQTALTYGITQQVETMSEADRQALRYLTMMEQVRNATKQVVDTTEQASGIMGDFARNIETPANQLRIFKEQVTQLGRAIGNLLLPILSKLLPVVNGIIMALRTVLGLLASLTGFSLNFGGSTTGAEEQAKALAGVGAAAGGASKALKELKKTLAPFDEINLLQAPNENTGGGGGGGATAEGVLNPALEEAIKSMSLSLEDIEMKANKVRDSLLKFFGFNYVEVFNPETGEYEKKLQWFADQFETNLINKFPQWRKTIESVFDSWPATIDGLKNLFSSLGEVVDALKEKFKSFADSLHLDDTFSQAIETLPSNLNQLSSWISDNKDTIADLAIKLGLVFAAFRTFRTVGTFLAPLISFGARIAPLVAALANLILPLATVAATLALLYVNSESFATAFQNLFQTVVESFAPIAESVVALAARIWESMQTLWEQNLQPMVASIGDALAPIINTLSVLWSVLSSLFQGTMDLLGSLWEGFVSPILAAVANAISALMGIIQALWQQVIGPVLENILKSLPNLFNNVVKPIIEKVMSIIAGLIEIILAIWSNVLAPLIGWLISTLGPTVRNIANTIWNIISSVISSIGKVINGLLTVIKGVIDFVAGVFTGDWERAWNGIKEIFAGVINAIIGIFEAGVNLIISAINGLISLIWSALQAFVNAILSTVNSVAEVLGFSINLQWGSAPPAIGYVSLPTVAFASGGVVTGPTHALIGEGHYDEAVIPLGNSPQMNDFADKIAGKIDNTEQVALLREQNQLLRSLLEQSGNSIGIRDLSGEISRIQRQEARAGGY